MQVRSRVVSEYREVTAVTGGNDLAGVPANAAAIDQIIAAGGLIFRDPTDREYLLVVEPSGVDLGYEETGLMGEIAANGYMADIYSAPAGAVLPDEQGWDVLLIAEQPESGAEQDAALAELVPVAADLSNLPELANPDVARQILAVGGLIYTPADDEGGGAGDYPDYDGVDGLTPPTAWIADGLNGVLSDPQDATAYTSGYIRVVIPASVPRIQFGQLTRLADKLAEYGIGADYDEFEDSQGSYHIGYLMGLEL